MADAITIKALQDASLDAKSLEEVVNGDEAKQVTTRKGETYPSVKKAIKTMFENGGLPATPFQTKALMEASALIDGDYAVVTEDADNLNGLYIKQLNEWVQSKYDLSSFMRVAVKGGLYPFSLEEHDGGDALDITDNEYNIIAKLDSDLRAHFKNLTTNDIQVTTLDLGFGDGVSTGSPLSITDNNGNVVAYFDNKGFFHYLNQYDVPNEVTESKEQAEARIDTDIIHITMYGQSLSLGLGAGEIQSKASEAPNALVPSSGIEDGQQSSVLQGINALPLTSSGLVAFNPSLNANQTAENPIYSATIHLQNSLDERGSGSKVLAATHGYGAKSVNGLSRGTINYDVGIAQSKKYREYASQRGDSCLTQFILWVQGEADISSGMNPSDYKDKLNTLLENYQEDIEQSGVKPIMLSYQVSSHTKRLPYNLPVIAYAQLELSKENPYFKVACATYPMTYYDGVHMVADSYRWMGAYFGKVMDWMLENKRTDWKPLQPEKILRTGRVITVLFHVPVKPLVFDTDMVSNPSDYGFIVNDSLGEKLTIESINIKGGDKVNIVLAEEPESSIKVTYALGVTGSDAGAETGARGNLRDSDPTISKALDKDGNPYTLYNWCVLFSQKEEV